MYGLQPGDEVPSGSHGDRHGSAHSAELVGPTQQTLNSYETGRCRVPVSLLPAIAKRLGVSVEELLDDGSRPASRCGSTPKMPQQMDRINQLPRSKQQFVMQVIESVLAQAAR